jgi:hypothetical protein
MVSLFGPNVPGAGHEDQACQGHGVERVRPVAGHPYAVLQPGRNGGRAVIRVEPVHCRLVQVEEHTVVIERGVRPRQWLRGRPDPRGRRDHVVRVIGPDGGRVYGTWLVPEAEPDTAIIVVDPDRRG